MSAPVAVGFQMAGQPRDQKEPRAMLSYFVTTCHHPFPNPFPGLAVSDHLLTRFHRRPHKSKEVFAAAPSQEHAEVLGETWRSAVVKGPHTKAPKMEGKDFQSDRDDP